MGSGRSKILTAGLKHCTIWKADRSPACRAVMMTVDAINLSVTEIDVDMDKGDHRSPEMIVQYQPVIIARLEKGLFPNEGTYLIATVAYDLLAILNAEKYTVLYHFPHSMMNPLQTLPILKDRELILYDSHAICTYLVSRYCNSGRLLPKDPGGRALVDQQLYYNNGVLYPRFRNAAYPILYENCSFVMPQQVCEIECAYADLETLLTGKNWLGGSWPGLGDITLCATISTLHILVPIDKLRYPRLSSWLFRMSEEIYYITANKKGLGEFSRRIDCGRVCDEKEFKCPRSSLRRRSLVGTPEVKQA